MTLIQMWNLGGDGLGRGRMGCGLVDALRMAEVGDWEGGDLSRICTLTPSCGFLYWKK